MTSRQKPRAILLAILGAGGGRRLMAAATALMVRDTR